jgi:hypothetical protein
MRIIVIAAFPDEGLFEDDVEAVLRDGHEVRLRGRRLIPEE